MKVLMISNKVKTYAPAFQNDIEPFLGLGYEVVWAADFSRFVGDRSVIPCVTEQIDINTNPLNPVNIRAFRQLCELIRKHGIDAIQCSTPIGGLLGRLAGKKMKIPAVIYAAHGFLFFKGAPLINRTVYKWEEILLAHWTDILVTITPEDYQQALKLKLRSGRGPYLVHGAGVRVGVRVDIDPSAKRREIGIPEDAFMIVSAGELNRNKNTQVIVRALANLKGRNVHYAACGVGSEEDRLKTLAERLGVSRQFHLLGYRTDMPEIMAASDVFTMMSFREGLPRAVLEAMDLGLPCVGSDTRGIRDLIDKNGGFICDPTDPKAFSDAFEYLTEHPDERKRMGEYNRGKVKAYSSEVVREELTEIYKETL